MIKPPALNYGDSIGLVATARKISRKELQVAINILEEWGLSVQLAPNLFKAENQFAGSDAQRLSDIQSFIDNPEIKAILCVRGGYGTVRIVDQINFLPLIESPKWIGGYSDVSVIVNKLSRLRIESLHCSMPINFEKNSEMALDSIRKALFGEALNYTIPNHPLNTLGVGKGAITGGNLSMLYSQMGSDSALKTDGCILFLEDLDEYLYHIDRMMYGLKRSGYFENLAGVIVGSMSDMNDNTIPFGESAYEIIHRHFKDYSFPVCFGFPAGHQDDNRTLIFSRQATLEVEANQVNLSYHG